MAVTPTIPRELGFEAPGFKLYEPLTKQFRTLDELKSDKATVIMFICNHCPYVKHIFPELIRVADKYTAKGVAFIGINSNDAKRYPADSPQKMVKEVTERGIGFPYLFDETQDIARAYDAACTPDFNIFDGDMRCVYRGQFDDSRPSNTVPVTGKDLSKALDAVLAGSIVSPDQRPSIGCSIKWKLDQ